MATEILVKDGTAIVLADTTDYAGDGGARTNQIDLTSIASTEARQSDKIDLLEARAARFSVTLCVEFDVAPSSGNIVSLYFAPSISETAGTANPGGVSGADSAYTGTASDSLADSIKQLDLIGALVCTSDAATVVNLQPFTYFPPTRYGSVVVYNEADQAFEGDAVEMFVTFTPLIDEAQ